LLQGDVLALVGMRRLLERSRHVATALRGAA